jgi:hypothetical protein
MTLVPEWAISQRAFNEMPSLLARTLANCLFWYQIAENEVEGELAVWKTGRDLSVVLGIKPRTVNAHQKQLAKLGYWRIVRKSRPGYNSPSPVNWLIPTPKSLHLLEEAGRLAEQQRTNKATKQGGSKAPKADVQMSVRLTDLSLPSLPSPATPFSFTPGEKAKAKAKTKSSGGSGKKTGEEAPAEIKVYVNGFQERLVDKGLTPWDLSTPFTWQHGESFYRRMEAHGLTAAEIDLWTDALLDWWSGILAKLPHKYQAYPGNFGRPSPMALGEEADLVVGILAQMQAPKPKPDPLLYGKKYKF